MKIHIMGAAGSGTSTLGEALGKVLPHEHLDTDDYFWMEKYTEQRPVEERKKLLEEDLNTYDDVILSGALCGWGDSFRSSFDLIIFLWIPEAIRLQRLADREFVRYGKASLYGGSHYEQSQAFLEWASLYDQGGLDVRSRIQHENWLKDVSCPVLKIEEDYSTRKRVHIVLDYLQAEMERGQL